MSSNPRMLNPRQVIRAAVFALLVSLFMAAPASLAYGQDFTLTPSALTPPAGVDPGGTATASVAVNTPDGFTGSVTLTCTVTSNLFTTDLPACLVSPSSVTPDATASLTLTTTGATQASQYVITVTGTSGSETAIATPLYLNVVDVPQDYTLTVSKAISPGTVNPGSGAQATVTVTPIASYTGSVTLSCLSITPVVTAAPICAFNPTTVAVTNGAAPTSVLTITTYGTLQNHAKVWFPRTFYALWLAFPGLALVGVGAGGSRRKKLLGLLLLLAVASGLLVLPSCGGNSPTSNNTSGLVTPKNTYTFTLTGVDANGVGPSNTTGTTTQATVSLTVN